MANRLVSQGKKASPYVGGGIAGAILWDELFKPVIAGDSPLYANSYFGTWDPRRILDMPLHDGTRNIYNLTLGGLGREIAEQDSILYANSGFLHHLFDLPIHDGIKDFDGIGDLLPATFGGLIREIAEQDSFLYPNLAHGGINSVTHPFFDIWVPDKVQDWDNGFVGDFFGKSLSKIGKTLGISGKHAAKAPASPPAPKSGGGFDFRGTDFYHFFTDKDYAWHQWNSFKDCDIPEFVSSIRDIPHDFTGTDFYHLFTDKDYAFKQWHSFKDLQGIDFASAQWSNFQGSDTYGVLGDALGTASHIPGAALNGYHSYLEQIVGPAADKTYHSLNGIAELAGFHFNEGFYTETNHVLDFLFHRQHLDLINSKLDLAVGGAGGEIALLLAMGLSTKVLYDHVETFNNATKNVANLAIGSAATLMLAPVEAVTIGAEIAWKGLRYAVNHSVGDHSYYPNIDDIWGVNFWMFKNSFGRAFGSTIRIASDILYAPVKNVPLIGGTVLAPGRWGEIVHNTLRGSSAFSDFRKELYTDSQLTDWFPTLYQNTVWDAAEGDSLLTKYTVGLF
jgi:hypothetical protein